MKKSCRSYLILRSWRKKKVASWHHCGDGSANRYLCRYWRRKVCNWERTHTTPCPPSSKGRHATPAETQCFPIQRKSINLLWILLINSGVGPMAISRCQS
ncbi:hypothetical protein FKM82_017658 [Ascaphus truei]